jgi:LmbE family N-acetylglucosaminyl deacetylase
MKLLFVHAHFDDYEFTAAGTFEKWRRQAKGSLRRRVLVCTDGGAGHHRLSREATAQRRLEEQKEAARLGGFEFSLLQDSVGRPFREARLATSTEFLPALWREIREYEPDYLFCPPIPQSTLVGVHVDHLDVAQAIRSVGYMINVPHAFTPEYPDGGGEVRQVRTPVILNTYDGYMAGGHGHDLAVEITDVADFAADLAWCHASQLREWLPWVDRHNLSAPSNPVAWREQFRELIARRKRALGICAEGLFEVFSVTAWGAVPSMEQLLADIPGVCVRASHLDQLSSRLREWRVAGGE